MPVKAIKALLRDPSSGVATSMIKAGTAEEASGPIEPIACAASPLTRASASFNAAKSDGRQPRMSSEGTVRLFQVPAEKFRNNAPFRRTRTSESTNKH